MFEQSAVCVHVGKCVLSTVIALPSSGDETRVRRGLAGTNIPKRRERRRRREGGGGAGGRRRRRDLDDAACPRVTQRVMRPIHVRSSALRCHVGIAGRRARWRCAVSTKCDWGYESAFSIIPHFIKRESIIHREFMPYVTFVWRRCSCRN